MPAARPASKNRPDLRYERRWRIPPPYLLGSEPIEGGGILEEFPGPLGVLLWQCMRDVNLWALSPADARDGLFGPQCEERRLAELLAVGASAREIEEPVRAIAAMLSYAPDTAPEVMMLACHRISQWAEVRGAVATALSFAQAGALAVPASARASLRVGRLSRQRGEHARAEGWLQRTIVLARQNRERETHAWAYTALGVLYFTRGNMPLAERCHLRALRVAERHGLRSRAAAALHDMFVLCGETGRPHEAVGYARRAVMAYGPLHPKLPSLAHDVAHLWMVQGHFTRALPVLRVVWPHMGSQQILGLCSVARAAGGAGDTRTFEEYWRRTLAALPANERIEHKATVWLTLARGAAALGEWERAEYAVGQALDLANELSEFKTRFEAEALLESVQNHRRVVEQPQATPVPHEEELADQFAGELVNCLAGNPA